MDTATAGYGDDDLDDGINGVEGADEADNLQATISDLWGTGRVITNFFKKAQLASLSTTAPRPLRMFITGSTAIHLIFDPSLQHQAIDNIAEKFCLPDFAHTTDATPQQFYCQAELSHGLHISLPTSNVSTWYLSNVESSKFAQSFFLNKYIDKDFYYAIVETHASHCAISQFSPRSTQHELVASVCMLPAAIPIQGAAFLRNAQLARVPFPRFTMYMHAHFPALERPIAPAIQKHPSTVHQAL
ncbi:uncharacterized protein F5147DRAFT_649828 [Suillus discolor]|uniref:DUF6830 domain-containing protein n=1 Tax=Suillus discolor TaxID=1912936 RepID=A0A9P7FDZ1_9AGAM|nr:uncharacterized protein F5147DRAFT_649828 [Suillus discolor]KAG2114664.1 hypothetical protein F5147DRAFT_649828 [Suillus discolor]